MSVVVELSALAEHVERFGPVAYLVTVDGAGHPHVVSVRPDLDADRFRAGAGRQTAANLAERPGCTLLFPAPPGEGYGLLVDGEGEVHGEGEDRRLAVRPTRAVLHRTPEGDPAAPSCVTVLSQPSA